MKNMNSITENTNQANINRLRTDINKSKYLKYRQKKSLLSMLNNPQELYINRISRATSRKNLEEIQNLIPFDYIIIPNVENALRKKKKELRPELTHRNSRNNKKTAEIPRSTRNNNNNMNFDPVIMKQLLSKGEENSTRTNEQERIYKEARKAQANIFRHRIWN